MRHHSWALLLGVKKSTAWRARGKTRQWRAFGINHEIFFCELIVITSSGYLSVFQHQWLQTSNLFSSLPTCWMPLCKSHFTSLCSLFHVYSSLRITVILISSVSPCFYFTCTIIESVTGIWKFTGSVMQILLTLLFPSLDTSYSYNSKATHSTVYVYVAL
jgi:hypothetical protein